MTRTQEEILSRMKQVEKDDFFGFQRTDLLEHLDFENAKQFLKDGVTEADWKKETRTPKEVMTEYLSFAFEKAKDKRGLSAGRSMEHYTSWLWLDGDEVLHKTLDEYTDYGIPQLIEICKYLGVDHNQYMK